MSSKIRHEKQPKNMQLFFQTSPITACFFFMSRLTGLGKRQLFWHVEGWKGSTSANCRHALPRRTFFHPRISCPGRWRVIFEKWRGPQKLWRGISTSSARWHSERSFCDKYLLLLTLLWTSKCHPRRFSWRLCEHQDAGIPFFVTLWMTAWMDSVDIC